MYLNWDTLGVMARALPLEPRFRALSDRQSVALAMQLFRVVRLAHGRASLRVGPQDRTRLTR